MRRNRPLGRDGGIQRRLWLRLKALQDKGWRFQKDSPFRTFLLPFVEHDALLVVELEEDRSRRSLVRDRLLREGGYTILRFAFADAQSNLASVVGSICAVLEDRRD